MMELLKVAFRLSIHDKLFRLGLTLQLTSPKLQNCSRVRLSPNRIVTIIVTNK